MSGHLNPENVMNRHTGQAALFLAVLLAVAAAAGQRIPVALKANIPFPFVVADHTLPAGRYAVSTLGKQTLRIAGSKKQRAFVLTSAVPRQASERPNKLVFHRYQDTYSWAQVWGPGDTGRQIHKSHAEEDLESKGKQGDRCLGG